VVRSAALVGLYEQTPFIWREQNKNIRMSAIRRCPVLVFIDI